MQEEQRIEFAKERIKFLANGIRKKFVGGILYGIEVTEDYTDALLVVAYFHEALTLFDEFLKDANDGMSKP